MRPTRVTRALVACVALIGLARGHAAASPQAAPSAQLADPHASHAAQAASPQAPAGTVPVPEDDRLPVPEERAKAALDKSPRHGEWADIPVAGSSVPVRSWVVYPERKDKAPVVVVIHEIYGLTDWIRAVADQLARDGFIAVAPDLVSGMGPNGGGTGSVASRDDVVKLVRALTPEEVTARLDAVRAYALRIPAATRKTATLGFCWGGSASFAYAASQPALDAAVVYYGSSPPPEALGSIRAPVLGLYGGDDARVNVTIAPAQDALKSLGRTFDPHVFDGAGHGFLRAQGGRDGANLKATRQAWPATLAFLREHLK